MPYSNTIEGVVQDWLDGGSAPTTTYAGQYVGFAAGSAPTGATPNECTDANYQRHAATWATATGNNPRIRTDSTAFQVFDKAGAVGAATTQTITGILRFDAATGGNFLEYVAFGSPVTVAAGSAYNWAAGSLSEQLS